ILGRFDNDEDLDAVVANKSTDQLTLLVNNGSGVFTKGASFSSGGKNPTALVTGLFNNDTIPDIAVTNYGTHPTGGDFGNVAVLLGRGDGTFHPAVPYTVGFGPISIASGDFNGDGFVDLVSANFLANTASVLLGSSSGSFTVVTEALGGGQGPLQVSTGDIEGDGDLDVLVTNLLSQSISVIRNRRSQGGTGFEPAESFGVAEFQTSPRLAFANADFDRNTTTDIALVNSLSDSLKILRNNLVNGAHRIQLTGVETVSALNFGTRPDVLLPTMNPIPNPESIVEDAPQQIVPLSGIALGRTGGPALRITATSSDANVIPNPTINYVAGQATGEVRFTPSANRSGQVTVTVTARDAGADRVMDTPDDGVLSRLFTVTVKPVNDPPSFTVPRIFNLLEDSAAQTLVGFATSISAGPFETQTLSTFTVSNDRPALFAVPPSIDASGTLRFTPASNAVGTAVVSVTLTDNGDTAYGGSNLRTDTFLIAIDAVNDAPSITIGGNQTVQVAANRQTLSNFATGFNPGGGSDEASQSIAGFVVTIDKPELFSELPAISSTGTLTYTPSATRTGTAIVTVRVRDSGGSLNSGIDLSAASTFNIVVSPLPDTTPPNPVLTTTAAAIGNSRSLDVGIDFGEVVTGFTLSDFVLVNATVSELVDLGMGRYSVRVTAVNDGQLSVSLPAAAVRDSANNNSLVSNVLSRTVDTVVPTAVLSTTEPNPTTRSSFPFTIQFSEPVIGFEISDLVLLNATVSNWAEPTPGRFTATLNATTDGAVLVGFSSGAARDAAGNFNSTPTPLIVSVNTGAANYKPLLSTTEPAITSNKNWTAVIDFGRVVTGFEANDLVLTNATATITSLGSSRFQINVTSVNEGAVTIQLPADRVRDTNNHPNQASDPLTLQFVDTTNSDFGDAPLPYPTRLQENGAYHKRTTLFLGTSVDAESNGQPSALANGDDSTGSDDEDGVTWGTTLMVSPLVSTTASVVVTSSGAGFLDAWIDYNQDGDWSDPGEQIANKVAVASGKNAVSFTIPSTALVGATFARFRVSSVGGLDPTGKANDGEVEDYQVSLVGGANKVLDIRLSELAQYAFTVTNGSLVVTTGTKTIWTAPLSELGSVNAWDAVGQKQLAWSPVSALPGVMEVSSAPWQVNLVASGNIAIGTLSSALTGVNTIDLRAANRQTLVFQQRDIEAINTDMKLRIRMGADDVLQTSSAWRVGAGRVEGGLWIQSFVSGASTIEVQDALAWRNSVSQFDMDGDSTVSPLDVLHLVNAINNGTFGDGNLPVRNATHPAGFFDVDGDSRVSPLDVLGLINVINNQSAGEGESSDVETIDRIMMIDLDDVLGKRQRGIRI
ncbi:MAG: FG-GAP-like repeat-containing protein, partial [Pirellula sp.]